MNAVLRMTAITLGVGDLARSIKFYEALGLRRNARASSGDEVAFFAVGAVVLALYPWDKLAEDAELPDAPGPPRSAVPRWDGTVRQRRTSTALLPVR